MNLPSLIVCLDFCPTSMISHTFNIQLRNLGILGYQVSSVQAHFLKTSGNILLLYLKQLVFFKCQYYLMSISNQIWMFSTFLLVVTMLSSLCSLSPCLMSNLSAFLFHIRLLILVVCLLFLINNYLIHSLKIYSISRNLEHEMK